MATDAPHMSAPVHVLLEIDQPSLAETVSQILRDGGYVTSLTGATSIATDAIRKLRPHLAVIDMDIATGTLLDRLDVLELGAWRMAVIALTRRGGVAAKVAALNQGVDDVLVIPFPPEEFMARVGAVVRRTYHEAAPLTPALQLGELEIDILNRRVHVGSRNLHLTALDQSLLYLLASNAGRVLTRDQILDRLWGTDFMAESNVVDRHIRNLRVKLQDSWRQPRYIATVPGRGYCFLPPGLEATSVMSPCEDRKRVDLARFKA